MLLIVIRENKTTRKKGNREFFFTVFQTTALPDTQPHNIICNTHN